MFVSGYDGLIYSIGFLVGWPVIMFLIAEQIRNLGKLTLADVASYRFGQNPIRTMAAISSLVAVAFYLIAQMVGAGKLIELLFGLEYWIAVVATHPKAEAIMGPGTLVDGTIKDVKGINGGTNMVAIHLAQAVGGNLFLGFISAVAFATILAVISGLTLAGASAISHDLYTSVIARGRANENTELKVSKVATFVLGVAAIVAKPEDRGSSNDLGLSLFRHRAPRREVRIQARVRIPPGGGMGPAASVDIQLRPT